MRKKEAAYYTQRYNCSAEELERVIRFFPAPSYYNIVDYKVERDGKENCILTILVEEPNENFVNSFLLEQIPDILKQIWRTRRILEFLEVPHWKPNL